MNMGTGGGGGGTYRFLESAVLKDPPHTRVDPQVLPEVEECEERLPSCFERAADVAGYSAVGVLVCLDDHDAVPVVASEEEILA